MLAYCTISIGACRLLMTLSKWKLLLTTRIYISEKSKTNKSVFSVYQS